MLPPVLVLEVVVSEDLMRNIQQPVYMSSSDWISNW